MTRRATISFGSLSSEDSVAAAMQKLSKEAGCDGHRGETKAFTFTDVLQQRTTNSRREAMIDDDNFDMINFVYYRSFSIFLSFMV